MSLRDLNQISIERVISETFQKQWHDIELLGSLSSPSSKNKKNSSQKKFFIFWKMKLFGSNIKKFLIFSQKKDFLIFRETKTSINYLHFRKRNFFITQQTSYISRSNGPSSKNKKTHSEKMSYISGKWKVLAPNFKNLLYFRRKF